MDVVELVHEHAVFVVLFQSASIEVQRDGISILN
jgi:hypothetical protein